MTSERKIVFLAAGALLTLAPAVNNVTKNPFLFNAIFSGRVDCANNVAALDSNYPYVQLSYLVEELYLEFK